jgi:hypothetical protein
MAAGAAALPSGLLQGQQRRPRVGAIITEFRHMSHADVICSRLFDGYYPDGVAQRPRTQIVSMYLDQVPFNDQAVALAQRYRYSIDSTIEGALMRGKSELDVDAVLLIGEHGDYPENELGQKMYPRHRLLKGITDVFRKSGRSVPVFNDKHLSYDWGMAKEMYGWTKELNFPLMAGSSIPVTVRTPELEIPLGAKIKRAVQTGYGGTDAYGFHTLESLQCMVERREGGETGVASVEFLEGEAVWRWRDGPGKWSKPLLEAASKASPNSRPGKPEDNCKEPVLFLVNYRDGFEAAAFLLNGHLSSWDFACELDGKIASTHFGPVPQKRQLTHFDGLTHVIEDLFVTGKGLYPVERTYLTTGILAHLFQSKGKKRKVETPELKIAYTAPKNCYFQRS